MHFATQKAKENWAQAIKTYHDRPTNQPKRYNKFKTDLPFWDIGLKLCEELKKTNLLISLPLWLAIDQCQAEITFSDLDNDPSIALNMDEPNLNFTAIFQRFEQYIGEHERAVESLSALILTLKDILKNNMNESLRKKIAAFFHITRSFIERLIQERDATEKLKNSLKSSLVVSTEPSQSSSHCIEKPRTRSHYRMFDSLSELTTDSILKKRKTQDEQTDNKRKKTI